MLVDFCSIGAGLNNVTIFWEMYRFGTFAGRSAELDGSDTPPRTIEIYLTHMSFLYLFEFDELEHYG